MSNKEMRYRTKKCAALPAFNTLMSNAALHTMRGAAPSNQPLLTMEEWAPAVSSLTSGTASRFVDAGSPDGAEQCLFHGRKLLRREHDVVVGAVRTLLADPQMCPHGWGPDDAEPECMTVFTAVRHLCSDRLREETIKSAAHLKSETRWDQFGMVDYGPLGWYVVYVKQIIKLVKVLNPCAPPAEQTCSAVRLAIATRQLWRACNALKGICTGWMRAHCRRGTQTGQYLSAVLPPRWWLPPALTILTRTSASSLCSLTALWVCEVAAVILYSNGH